MDITKDKILKNIYFITSLTQRQTSAMQGALTSKADLMGGIFDRWINTTTEGIIFNEYIKPKIKKQINIDVEFVPDFYMYDPQKVLIAPDLLGVKVNNQIIPFVVYDYYTNQEGKKLSGWKPNNNCPQLEVKTLKKSQKMLTLRDQHYTGKYLILAEANLDVDYLIPFLDKGLFSEDIYKSLKMEDSVFIKADKKELISQTAQVNFHKDKIGEVEVAVITSAEDFMKKSNLCKSGISVQYINNDIASTVIKRQPQEDMCLPLLNYVNIIEKNIYKFNQAWYDDFVKDEKICTLNIKVDNIDNIDIVKKNRGSIYIKVKNNATINNSFLIEGLYKIEFAILKRGVTTEEYFMHKSIMDILENKEVVLIDEICKAINQNLKKN